MQHMHWLLTVVLPLLAWYWSKNFYVASIVLLLCMLVDGIIEAIRKTTKKLKKTGEKPSLRIRCPFCGGSGQGNQPMATPVGPQEVGQTCPHCHGTGLVWDSDDQAGP